MRAAALHAALAATWPPVGNRREGPWLLREGRGGGRRASAATAEAPVAAGDIEAMEAAQARLGQPALVMIREGEAELDARLAAAGYALADPTLAYAAPVTRLLDAPEPDILPVVHDWPPLAIANEIWSEGGVDRDRRAVMARVAGPKAVIISRTRDHCAAAGFVALHDGVAVLHAITTREKLRRQGAARKIMRGAAEWAQDVGATDFSLWVGERNSAARALYASLGMDVVGQYHYRMK